MTPISLSRRGLLRAAPVVGLAATVPVAALAQLSDAALADEVQAAGPEPDGGRALDPRAFGAKCDGITDDRAALQALIDASLAAGLPIHLPAGRYLIDSSVERAGLLIQSEDDITVRCDGVILGGANFASGIDGSGWLIRVQSGRAGRNTGQALRWTGGRFDGQALPPAQYGIDLLSIGPKFGHVTLSGIVFDHGETRAEGKSLGGGGGDSSIFVKEYEHLLLEGCAFFGARDSGVYLSGDNGEGRRAIGATVTGCVFRRCGNAVSIKRRAIATMVSNILVEDCGNGVLCGDTGHDDQGTSGTIGPLVMRRIQGNPIALENGGDWTVTGCVIRDYRRLVSDGKTAVEANVGAAVRLRGASRCSITGCSVGFEEWQAPTDPKARAYGFALVDYPGAQGTVPSRFNVISGCVVVGAFGGILASVNATDNVFGPNIYADVLNPDVVQGEGNERFAGGVMEVALGDARNYAARQGAWRIEGRMCHVSIHIELENARGLDGPVSITGLPFPAASTPRRQVGLVSADGVANSAGYLGFLCELEAGTDRLRLREVGPEGGRDLRAENFGPGSGLSVSLSYQVA